MRTARREARRKFQMNRWVEYQGTIFNISHVLRFSVKLHYSVKTEYDESGKPVPKTPKAYAIYAHANFGYTGNSYEGMGSRDECFEVGKVSEKADCEQGIRDMIAGRYDMDCGDLHPDLRPSLVGLAHGLSELDESLTELHNDFAGLCKETAGFSQLKARVENLGRDIDAINDFIKERAATID